MKRRSVHFARQTLPQMMNTERRYIHDFLFCLNLALVLKLEGNQKPNKFFSFFESGESLLQSKINASLHLHPHHSFGANLAFLLLALVLALLLFVVLRVLLTSSFLKNVFHSTAGVISLIALPVGWLWVSRLIGIAAPLPNPPRWALYLELSAVAAYAVLYSVGRWVLPLWLTMTLFAVHFGYWDFLVSRGPYFWLDPFSLIFPFVGLLATIACGWGLSLSKTSSPPNAKPAPVAS